MMKIRLLKGCPVNGSSVCTNCATKAEQDAYFDNFVHIDHEVNTVRMGEPFRIADTIEHLMPYNYGYIQYEDGGFRYYFYVADMAMITETQTEIRYNLDPYEITCFQGGLEVTRAYVTRHPRDSYCKDLPVTPRNWIRTPESTHAGATLLVMMGRNKKLKEFEEQGSTVGLSMLICPLSNPDQYREALNGLWYVRVDTNKMIPKDQAFLSSDVYSCCIVPFQVEIPSTCIDVTLPPKQIEGFESPTDSYFSIYYSNEPVILKVSDLGFTEIESFLYLRKEICDMRGNPMFECPVGEKWVVETPFINHYTGATPDTTTTVQTGVVYPTASGTTVLIRLKSGNSVHDVVIPCESVDVISDSWREYYYRSRDVEQNLRSLDRNSQLFNGLANSVTMGASNATSVLIGGWGSERSRAGNAIGAGAAGMLGGMVSAVGGWAIDSYYDPKYQQQYDRQARNESDPLLSIGSMSLTLFVSNVACMMLKMPDPWSVMVMTDYTATYGYPVEMYYHGDDPRVIHHSNGDEHISGPIQGSFDFTAECPEQWIDIIEQRFSIGVRMVK